MGQKALSYINQIGIQNGLNQSQIQRLAVDYFKQYEKKKGFKMVLDPTPQLVMNEGTNFIYKKQMGPYGGKQSHSVVNSFHSGDAFQVMPPNVTHTVVQMPKKILTNRQKLLNKINFSKPTVVNEISQGRNSPYDGMFNIGVRKIDPNTASHQAEISPLKFKDENLFEGIVEENPTEPT